MIYYERDGIRVRNSKKTDTFVLRETDKQEVWASHHHLPEEALRLSLEYSLFSCTIENGQPIGSFGIVPDSVIGDKASVWFLASDSLDKIKIRFLVNSKMFIKIMLEYYPYLYNYVDVRNIKSIKWLKSLGAVMEEPKPYGCDQLPFIYFYFRR